MVSSRIDVEKVIAEMRNDADGDLEKKADTKER